MEDDEDLIFLKSLLPEFRKAQNKRKLKRKLYETIDEFLEKEEMEDNVTTEIVYTTGDAAAPLN